MRQTGAMPQCQSSVITHYALIGRGSTVIAFVRVKIGKKFDRSSSVSIQNTVKVIVTERFRQRNKRLDGTRNGIKHTVTITVGIATLSQCVCQNRCHPKHGFGCILGIHFIHTFQRGIKISRTGTTAIPGHRTAAARHFAIGFDGSALGRKVHNRSISHRILILIGGKNGHINFGTTPVIRSWILDIGNNLKTVLISNSRGNRYRLGIGADASTI